MATPSAPRVSGFRKVRPGRAGGLGLGGAAPAFFCAKTAAQRRFFFWVFVYCTTTAQRCLAAQAMPHRHADVASGCNTPWSTCTCTVRTYTYSSLHCTRSVCRCRCVCCSHAFHRRADDARFVVVEVNVEVNLDVNLDAKLDYES